MSRRRAPRPAGEAFQAALRQVAPQTPLATLQAAWTDAVGERVAAVATPVSERGGVVTIECADAIWTQELDLMQEALLTRLQECLGEAAPTSLRFRLKSAQD